MIKLIKETTVTSKEVKEIEDGIYYFSCGYKGDEQPYLYKKITITSNKFNSADLEVYTVKKSYDEYTLAYEKNIEQELPYNLSFYFGGRIDEEKEYLSITEEQFEKVKQEVKEKL